MTNPLDIQHGGNHYKGMAIQPIQFAVANNYDAAAFSALKYVSRHRAKNGREDLLKAKHFIQLRLSLMSDHPEAFTHTARSRISIDLYVSANDLPVRDAKLLTVLHAWATETTQVPDSMVADNLIRRIDNILNDEYPENG